MRPVLHANKRSIDILHSGVYIFVNKPYDKP